jgi:hypothetical protein
MEVPEISSTKDGLVVLRWKAQGIQITLHAEQDELLKPWSKLLATAPFSLETILNLIRKCTEEHIANVAMLKLKAEIQKLQKEIEG